MPTYNFDKQADGSVRLFVDTVYKRTFIGAALIDVVDSDSFDIIDSTGGRHRYELTEKHLDGSTTNNVFKKAGVTVTGNVEAICQELDAVFPKATVISGGDGSGIASLDNVPQGTNTKKLTASEYTTLQQIIQAYTS